MAGQSKREIALHLEKLDDLFVEPEMNPFENMQLRTSGIETILDELRSRPSDDAVGLKIYLPSSQITPGPDKQVLDAIQRYCQFMVQEGEKEIATIRRTGRAKLFMGLVGMVICLLLSSAGYWMAQNTGSSLPMRVLAALLASFFSVASWVIVWNPLDSLVFEWRPIRRDNLVYQSISSAALTIVSEMTQPNPG